MYYRIYAEDGSIPSKTPAAPGDPFLGRIKARLVPPPHTAKAVKRCIAKMENIKDRTSTTFFLTQYSQSPMADDDQVTILSRTGPGSTPQEPLALVAKLSDSERSDLESEGRRGLANAEPDTGIRHRRSIQHSPTFLFVTSQLLEKCIIYCTPTIVVCLRKLPLIQRSHLLDVSGWILLHRLTVPPLSNDAFPE